MNSLDYVYTKVKLFMTDVLDSAWQYPIIYVPHIDRPKT